ncbi:MAG: acyltransferase [Actinobacteria bacterium]|nr:acyltransferase [Actinomycetota bacterium]MBI3688433.1 acyltransferase [Actinomycetota bacterium]
MSTWLGGRRWRRSTALAGGALALGIVASFLVSLHYTTVEQPWAYLSSPARSWQFGVGAVLALLGWTTGSRVARRDWPVPRALVGWSGLAAIGWATLTLTERTPYPGTAALIPTLGAAATIAAGIGTAGVGTGARYGPRPGLDAGLGPDRVLSTRPMRAVGRLSFTWYLWHWPAVVLAEAGYGSLGWPVKLAVVLGAGLPAWLTLRLVERPIRLSPALLGLPAHRLAVHSLVIGAVAMCLPVGAGLVSSLGAAREMRTATAGPVTPPPDRARDDVPHYPPECNVSERVVVSPSCVIGASRGAGHVVLLGDSHAGQWFGAVDGLAQRHGWATEVLVKGGCPLPAITIVYPRLGRPFTECDSWRDNTLRRLAAEPAPALVFMSVLDRYSPDERYVLAGWRPVLRRLAELHVPIVYLRDNPYPGTDVPSCISGALTDWSACRFGRPAAQWPDPLATAIATGSVAGVTMVDLTAVLCPPGPPDCPAVLGGTLLYRDYSHLTNTAVTALTPTLERALARSALLP